MIEESRRIKGVISQVNRLKTENKKLKADNELLKAQGRKILEFCDQKPMQGYSSFGGKENRKLKQRQNLSSHPSSKKEDS